MSNREQETFVQEERHVPFPFVARLISEIKSSSGLKNAKLAEKLEKCLNLSEAMIGQYLAGSKTMSETRMIQLAKAATDLGWKTPAVAEALMWEKLNEDGDYAELHEFSIEYNKRQYRSEAAMLKKLDSAISGLVRGDWSDGEVVALAILLTEKYIPQDKRTEGGMIDIGMLRAAISQDKSPHRNLMWLSWSMVGRAETIPLGK